MESKSVTEIGEWHNLPHDIIVKILNFAYDTGLLSKCFNTQLTPLNIWWYKCMCILTLLSCRKDPLVHFVALHTLFWVGFDTVACACSGGFIAGIARRSLTEDFPKSSHSMMHLQNQLHYLFLLSPHSSSKSTNFRLCFSEFRSFFFSSHLQFHHHQWRCCHKCFLFWLWSLLHPVWFDNLFLVLDLLVSSLCALFGSLLLSALDLSSVSWRCFPAILELRCVITECKQAVIKLTTTETVLCHPNWSAFDTCKN